MYIVLHALLVEKRDCDYTNCYPITMYVSISNYIILKHGESGCVIFYIVQENDKR